MVVKINSFALAGLTCAPVLVETTLSNQLPAFCLVGLASALTQESRERVRAAIMNSELIWPQKKVTVNLLPSDMPKWGTHFELPMALAIVGTTLPSPPEWEGIVAFGELSLSGEVRATGLAASLYRYVSEQRADHKTNSSITVLCAPEDAAVLQQFAESMGSALHVLAVTSLSHALQVLTAHTKAAAKVNAKAPLLRVVNDTLPVNKPDQCNSSGDHNQRWRLLSEVRDEPLAVLGALCALAHPEHHIMLAGPQGAGKSMTASAIVKARTNDDLRARAERALVERLLAAAPSVNSLKPVVTLQSTLSRAALEGAVGASGQLVPGELSRAHGGLAVMDEFLEFRRDALECLRRPLEEGVVRIQRARHRAVLPAKFQLIATTNLCPCGAWSPSTTSHCRCPHASFQAYIRKLSGPLIDRFSIFVVLGGRSELLLSELSPTAKALVNRLLIAASWPERVDRALKTRRLVAGATTCTVAGATAHPEDPSKKLTHRGRALLLELARTIAALDGKNIVTAPHQEVAQALRDCVNSSIKSYICI